MKTENERAYEKYCEKFSSYFDSSDIEDISDAEFQHLVAEAGESIDLIESVMGSMCDQDDSVISSSIEEICAVLAANTLQNDIRLAVNTVFVDVFKSIFEVSNILLESQKLIYECLSPALNILCESISEVSKLAVSIESFDEISVPIGCSAKNGESKAIVLSETYTESFTFPIQKSTKIKIPCETRNLAA